MPAGSFNRPSWRSFARSAALRLRLHWRLKAGLQIAAGVLFCSAYFLIGFHPLMPEHRLPLTALDRAIGFHPYTWIWVYQSLYIPINLIPWLADRREDLRRYAIGLVLLSAVSFAIFILYPIRASPPDAGCTRHVLAADPVRCHAQFFSVFARRFAGVHPRFRLAELSRTTAAHCAALCIIWGAAICYATLATKEHYAVDTLGGAVLGLAAHALAWRKSAPNIAGVSAAASAPDATAMSLQRPRTETRSSPGAS